MINFGIFVEPEECSAIFQGMAASLSMKWFAVREAKWPEMTTFVLHDPNSKIHHARSWNALWDKNDLRETLVVLTFSKMGCQVREGRYYASTSRRKRIHEARRYFEAQLTRGGYWISTEHPIQTGDAVPFMETFVGPKSLQQWLAGDVILGDPKYFFEPLYR